jgi:hypothetical protein
MAQFTDIGSFKKVKLKLSHNITANRTPVNLQFFCFPKQYSIQPARNSNHKKGRKGSSFQMGDKRSGFAGQTPPARSDFLRFEPCFKNSVEEATPNSKEIEGAFSLEAASIRNRL